MGHHAKGGGGRENRESACILLKNMLYVVLPPELLSTCEHACFEYRSDCRGIQPPSTSAMPTLLNITQKQTNQKNRTIAYKSGIWTIVNTATCICVCVCVCVHVCVPYESFAEASGHSLDNALSSLFLLLDGSFILIWI